MSATTNQLTIFISYTKEDLAWAEWIAGCVESVGHKAVYQRRDFAWDRTFTLEMHKALKESDLVLAVLSRHYLDSPWCEEEWTAAYGKLKLLRVAECEPDGLLAHRPFVDLVGRAKGESSCRLICDLLVPDPDRMPQDIEAVLDRLDRLHRGSQITDDDVLRIWVELGGGERRSIPSRKEWYERWRTARVRFRNGLLLNDSADLVEHELNSELARTRQVLVAARLGKDVVRVEEGIRWLLIPPGIAHRANQVVRNRYAYYLSEQPVHPLTWRDLMGGDAMIGAFDEAEAVVGITVRQMMQFVEHLREKTRLPIDLPTEEELAYPAIAGASNYLGVRELTGRLWQACRLDAIPHFGIWRGADAGRASAVPLHNQSHSSAELGLRLVLREGSSA